MRSSEGSPNKRIKRKNIEWPSLYDSRETEVLQIAEQWQQNLSQKKDTKSRTKEEGNGRQRKTKAPEVGFGKREKERKTMVVVDRTKDRQGGWGSQRYRSYRLSS